MRAGRWRSPAAMAVACGDQPPAGRRPRLRPRGGQQDHHIDPGATSRPSRFVSWPRHCVAGTAGAEFQSQLDTSAIKPVFCKGSTWPPTAEFGAPPDGVGLAEWLKDAASTRWTSSGSPPTTVRATAVDAARAGFRTRVLTNPRAPGCHRTPTAIALNDMRDCGVELVPSQ